MAQHCRDLNLRALVAHIVQFLVALEPNVNDVALWRDISEGYHNRFSAHATWELIRNHKEEVSWSKMVWFSQGTPRYSFITWLAMRDRLSTGARMRNWGQDQSCLFCGDPDESRDHLFFDCPYTFTLWLEITGLLLVTEASPEWETTIMQLMSTAQNYLSSIFEVSFSSVCVFHMERA